jgi:hypothetical protein
MFRQLLQLLQMVIRVIMEELANLILEGMMKGRVPMVGVVIGHIAVVVVQVVVREVVLVVAFYFKDLER